MKSLVWMEQIPAKDWLTLLLGTNTNQQLWLLVTTKILYSKNETKCYTECSEEKLSAAV